MPRSKDYYKGYQVLIFDHGDRADEVAGDIAQAVNVMGLRGPVRVTIVTPETGPTRRLREMSAEYTVVCVGLAVSADANTMPQPAKHRRKAAAK